MFHLHDAQIHILTTTVFFCQTECLLSYQVICVSSGNICQYIKISCVRRTHIHVIFTQIKSRERVFRGTFFLLMLIYMYSEAGEQQFWQGRGAVKAQTTSYSVEYCSLLFRIGITWSSKQYRAYRFKKNSCLLTLVITACVQERPLMMKSVC
jgi:hypothetical protein